MKIEKFEDIIAWQLGRELATRIYQVMGTCRDFGFRDQLQRAAISIMNNVAEGFDRKGDKELICFLRIAKGSCAEVRSMLYVAKDIGYISVTDFTDLFDLTVRIAQILVRFIHTVRPQDVGPRT